MLESESVSGESVEEYVNELTADRLQHKTYRVPIESSRTSSGTTGSTGSISQIDAEKSELDIIEGIENHDWPKSTGRARNPRPSREAVERIEALLTEKGYRCAVEQETLLEHAGSSSLCDPGRRRGPFRHAVGRQSEANVHEFGAALRSSRTSAVSFVLAVCPRTRPRTPTRT